MYKGNLEPLSDTTKTPQEPDTLRWKVENALKLFRKKKKLGINQIPAGHLSPLERSSCI